MWRDMEKAFVTTTLQRHLALINGSAYVACPAVLADGLQPGYAMLKFGQDAKVSLIEAWTDGPQSSCPGAFWRHVKGYSVVDRPVILVAELEDTPGGTRHQYCIYPAVRGSKGVGYVLLEEPVGNDASSLVIAWCGIDGQTEIVKSGLILDRVTDDAFLAVECVIRGGSG